MAGENQEAAPAAASTGADTAPQVSGSDTSGDAGITDFLNEFSNLTETPDGVPPAGDAGDKSGDAVPPASTTPEVPAGTKPGEAAPAVVPPTTPTPAVPTGQDDKNPLVDAVAKLTETLDKQKPAETPVKPGEEPLPFEIPAYNFEVNDKLMENLYSEDANVRKQAMATLLQANNQAIHKSIGTQMFGLMREVVKAAVPHIIQMANTTQQQGGAQRQVHDDFYGKFPTLKHDAIKPLVMREAQAMVKEGKFTNGWDATFRDALGQRIVGMLAAAAGATIPQAQPAVAPVPAARPPVMVAPRAAPSAPNGQPTELQQDVAALLDF